jgi:hypothetical protein
MPAANFMQAKTASSVLGRGATGEMESDIMKSRQTETPSVRTQDKQLQGISLEVVLEKRRLGQAMNAKEFAVCAGVSYSTARSWFRLGGFPVFRGVIFWQDFVEWRTNKRGLANQTEKLPQNNGVKTPTVFPPRAAQPLILYCIRDFMGCA